MDKFKTILTLLAITSMFEFDSNKRVSLSKEQLEKLQLEHKKKFGTELQLAGLEFDDEGYTSLHENELVSIEAALSKPATITPDTSDKKEDNDVVALINSLKTELNEIKNQNTLMQQQIESLSEDPDTAQAVVIQLGVNPKQQKNEQLGFGGLRTPMEHAC